MDDCSQLSRASGGGESHERQQAKLEGLLEGLREAMTGRKAA